MKVTKREVDRVLRESSFAPKTNPKMRIIADVGDYAYYLRRAIEELTNLQNHNQFSTFDSLTDAISLLALAKIAFLRNHQSE
jgi:hypothetical protein